MKKIWILLTLMLLSMQSVFAEESVFPSLCPSTYELTSGFSRFASHATGSNLIHTQILERYLEKQLKSKYSGKYKVKIDSFSAKDLKNGKFKSISATGENITIDQISVSKATLNSICEFNRLERSENSNLRFANDFPANLTIELSADDLNKITQTTDYKNSINEINNIFRGMLKIEDIKFDVRDSKLWYDFVFSTPFSPKKQAVHIGTSLSLYAGDVNVKTDHTTGKPTILSILNLTDTLNFINPLDFSTKILENNTIDANLNEIYANEDKIILKAFINIRK